VILAVVSGLASCSRFTPPHVAQGPGRAPIRIDTAQVPTWSREDLQFFLHGSMSTEFIPERVLHAFVRTYPDLFPRPDLGDFGLVPDPDFGWPVGFSRREVPHLGGLSSVGVNCAACHATEVAAAPDGTPAVLVLGGTSHFDAEAFFGAVTIATFRTADPVQMRRFLSAYLLAEDPAGAEHAEAVLASL